MSTSNQILFPPDHISRAFPPSPTPLPRIRVRASMSCESRVQPTSRSPSAQAGGGTAALAFRMWLLPPRPQLLRARQGGGSGCVPRSGTQGQNMHSSISLAQCVVTRGQWVLTLSSARGRTLSLAFLVVWQSISADRRRARVDQNSPQFRSHARSVPDHVAVCLFFACCVSDARLVAAHTG